MSPIIVLNCSCDKSRRIYVSIPRETYFKERVKNKEWQLEYSKRVKEEKYKFYKENVISSGDQRIEYENEKLVCKQCGKSIKI